VRIQLDGVFVTLGESTILEDITLDLVEDRIGVIGPNGSGKSTFARLLNGLVLPARGSVIVDGLDTRHDARKIRQRIGFVFQNPDNQIVFPLVADDLAFGLRNVGVPRAEIPDRIGAQLERFGIAELEQRASHTLSGGEKQLVALAAVMVMRPGLVVFDEPTTLLDLRNRNRIGTAIAAMPEPAIVVTHDLELICEFDRVIVLDEGRVRCDDVPSAATRWYLDHLS
jgi:biotin transport system ATP-binding protein